MKRGPLPDFDQNIDKKSKKAKTLVETLKHTIAELENNPENQKIDPDEQFAREVAAGIAQAAQEAADEQFARIAQEEENRNEAPKVRFD